VAHDIDCFSLVISSIIPSTRRRHRDPRFVQQLEPIASLTDPIPRGQPVFPHLLHKFHCDTLRISKYLTAHLLNREPPPRRESCDLAVVASQLWSVSVSFSYRLRTTASFGCVARTCMHISAIFGCCFPSSADRFLYGVPRGRECVCVQGFKESNVPS
jgi:hypothetical protein